MKLSAYLEEKLSVILLNSVLMFFFFFYFLTLKSTIHFIFLFIAIWLLCLLFYFIYDYVCIKKKYDELIELTDSLDQKYLISEIIKKPKHLSQLGYYYALKKGNKSMCDQVSNQTIKQKEYQEYIERWVHEIKTPISALSLLCDNEPNARLKNELNKINHYVEQVLFYARSENTEKDYFIKDIHLEELIHASILSFRTLLLGHSIILNIHDLDYIVYTDEKWVHFILNQILSNSIKYMNKDNPIIEIYATKKQHGIELTIKDNGIGIPEHDIDRIFDAGFTGFDRKKAHSTGMGLYISKKLCDKLHLNITVESRLNKYTCIHLTFPKGNVHRFD